MTEYELKIDQEELSILWRIVGWLGDSEYTPKLEKILKKVREIGVV